MDYTIFSLYLLFLGVRSPVATLDSYAGRFITKYGKYSNRSWHVVQQIGESTWINRHLSA